MIRGVCIGGLSMAASELPAASDFAALENPEVDDVVNRFWRVRDMTLDHIFCFRQNEPIGSRLEVLPLSRVEGEKELGLTYPEVLLAGPLQWVPPHAEPAYRAGLPVAPLIGPPDERAARHAPVATAGCSCVGAQERRRECASMVHTAPGLSRLSP